MKTPFAFLLLAAALAASTANSSAQSPDILQRQRVAASFVLALGRAPSAAETEEWAQQGPRSVADLLARHGERLAGDSALKRATIARACVDAFGRAPTAEELEAAAGDAGTYTGRMQRHVASLRGDPAGYEQVLHRTYRLVVGRDVYPEEIEYWKGRDALPFALVVGCLENWARRNQPGLMVTTGTPTVAMNSTFLVTAFLAPAVAEEARVAAGLAEPRSGPPEVNPGAYGRNLVAAGASQVVTSGHMSFAAAGAPGLVPMGAGE